MYCAKLQHQIIQGHQRQIIDYSNTAFTSNKSNEWKNIPCLSIGSMVGENCGMLMKYQEGHKNDHLVFCISED